MRYSEDYFITVRKFSFHTLCRNKYTKHNIATLLFIIIVYLFTVDQTTHRIYNVFFRYL